MVQEDIRILTKQLKIINTELAYVMMRFKIGLLYNFLISFGILSFSIFCLSNDWMTKRYLLSVIYSLLILNDYISFRFTRRMKRSIFTLYSRGTEVVRLLGDAIEWNAERKKMQKSLPKEIINTIKDFYMASQTRYFPYKTGFEYDTLLTIINMITLLFALVVFLKILLENFSV